MLINQAEQTLDKSTNNEITSLDNVRFVFYFKSSCNMPHIRSVIESGNDIYKSAPRTDAILAPALSIVPQGLTPYVAHNTSLLKAQA
mmetsp:Transcript_544/g.652  ORF Transcript_544/g.652 Transcript_544/m.652 type:complete len:87 (-) Transcript_544:75-335(-)